ncbi:MAG: XRE family transcriptional regulator [Chloroflexi bacterium]|nr:XRE family transcriptional regulator [Chloroflexota bacterium]
MSNDLSIAIGSGNVFADLELENADELLARSQLGFAVREQLELRGHSSVGATAAFLEIDIDIAVDLIEGRFYLFTETQLIGFLNRLERKVTLMVTPYKQGERKLEVKLAT